MHNQPVTQVIILISVRTRRENVPGLPCASSKFRVSLPDGVVISLVAVGDIEE